jgi:hypothetical protein
MEKRLINKVNPKMRDLIYDFMNDDEIDDMTKLILDRERNK